MSESREFDWDKEVIPYIHSEKRVEELRRAFESAGLELTEEAVDAVYKDCELSVAFIFAYGDHCEGLSPLTLEDIDRCFTRAVQKIIGYIIKYNDPNYDPMMNVMDGFGGAGLSAEELKQLFGEPAVLSCSPEGRELFEGIQEEQRAKEAASGETYSGVAAVFTSEEVDKLLAMMNDDAEKRREESESQVLVALDAIKYLKQMAMGIIQRCDRILNDFEENRKC